MRGRTAAGILAVTLALAGPSKAVEYYVWADVVRQASPQEACSSEVFRTRPACQSQQCDHKFCFVDNGSAPDVRWPFLCGWTANNGAGNCPLTVATRGPVNVRCSANSPNGTIVSWPLQCPEWRQARKNAGWRCGVSAGDPVNTATGNVYLHETDYAGTGPAPLVFARHYNSASDVELDRPPSVGRGWRMTYDRYVQDTGSTTTGIAVYREDGQAFLFTLQDGYWTSDKDVTGRLEVLFSPVRYRYTAEDDSVEEYDADGRLVSLTTRAGLVTVIAYDAAGRVVTVTDPFGKALQFGYSGPQDPKIVSVTAPGNVVFRYEYDSRSRLRRVYSPNETPDPADDPHRRYEYEEDQQALPYALTRVFDENGGTTAWTTWDYDGQGRAILEEHGDGAHRISLDYKVDGTTDVTDAKGAVRTYAFVTEHNTTKSSAISGAGCTTCGAAASTQYDANGFVSARVDYLGNRVKYGHDARGLETCRVEGNSPESLRKTTTAWHASLRVPTARTVWRHAGGAYDPLAACDAAGILWTAVRTIGYSYSAGRLTARTETDAVTNVSRTWNYDYDPPAPANIPSAVPASVRAALPWRVRGPREHVAEALDITEYSYDAQGHVASVRDPVGLVTAVASRDGQGRPLQVVAPDGAITTLTWHPRGWLRTATTAGSTTTLDYDNVGQVTKITTGAGDFLAWQYDSAHRLTRITDSTGDFIAITPDAFGNAGTVAYTESGGATVRRTVQRVYNALNRLEKTVGGAGQTTWYTYDANGDPACTFDPRHAAAGGTTVPVCPAGAPGALVTKQVRDALRRVVTEYDADGGVTTTGHDALDRVTSVDPPGAVTATTFPGNGFGEDTGETGPDRGTRGYTYDPAGNLKTETDGRGVVATHAYDAANRRTGTTFSGTTPAIAWQWDTPLPGRTCTHGAGRLCGLSDESGTTAYAYDARGNVTTKTVDVSGPGTFTAGGTFETHYTHDGADRLTTLTYPSGRQVRYARDTAGRIAGVYTRPASGAEVAVVTGVQYAPFGPIEAMDFGNGIKASATLDADYRITAIDHGGATLGNLRDAADNLTQETDVQPLGRGYDALSRLTMADDYYLPSATEGYYYSYDANGNRTGKVRYTSDTWFNSLYTFDPPTSNRLRLIVPGGQPWEPSIDPEQVRTHDAAGNVTSIDYNGASSYLADIALVYGGHGRPTTVTTGVQASPLLTVAIGHNGLGQRVRMDVTSGSQASQFPDKTLHYDEAGHIIAEYRATGEAYEYLYLDDLPVGFVHYANAQSAGTLYYYHTDQLGTPRWATNGAGAVVWTAYQVDPFRLNGSGTVNPGLRFAGQYYQPETGFYYNYFRDYDPATGRYLQADPIGLAGGLNAYVFVENNPLRFSDPEGLNAYAAVAGAYRSGYAVGRSLSRVYEAVTGSSIGSDIYDICEAQDPPGSKGFEDDNSPIEPYPLKGRERRNKERREKPKDPVEKEKRQRDFEDRKRRTGRGGSQPTPTDDDW